MKIFSPLFNEIRKSLDINEYYKNYYEAMQAIKDAECNCYMCGDAPADIVFYLKDTITILLCDDCHKIFATGYNYGTAHQGGRFVPLKDATDEELGIGSKDIYPKSVPLIVKSD